MQWFKDLIHGLGVYLLWKSGYQVIDRPHTSIICLAESREALERYQRSGAGTSYDSP